MLRSTGARREALAVGGAPRRAVAPIEFDRIELATRWVGTWRSYNEATRMTDDERTPDQIRQHYIVERELSDRLRKASRQERRRLYSSLYDELFRRVPLHPQLTRKVSAAQAAANVQAQLAFLHRFLRDGMTFLEIGPGDCALSFELARRAKQVYAVDVSNEITKVSAYPENFQLILSDGCNVPVAPGSVDVAYSNQLMEHLHPDDAIEQLRHIYEALALGGIYVCVTPNRLTGPHDHSQYFDSEATCFHLKEYTTSELNQLFRKVGFSRVRTYVGGKGRYLGVPVSPIALCEMTLNLLNNKTKKAVARSLPCRPLLGIRLVGIK